MEKQNIRKLALSLGRVDQEKSAPKVLYVEFDTSEEYDSWIRGKQVPLTVSLQDQKTIEERIRGMLSTQVSDPRYFLPIILVNDKYINCETFPILDEFQRCERVMVSERMSGDAFNAFKKYMTKDMIRELTARKKKCENVVVFLKVDEGCPCGLEGPCYHKVEGL
jgi:hypothetical protein